MQCHAFLSLFVCVNERVELCCVGDISPPPLSLCDTPCVCVFVGCHICVMPLSLHARINTHTHTHTEA
jgi:hypothetical protein